MSSWASRIMRKPVRISAWSSAISTRIGASLTPAPRAEGAPGRGTRHQDAARPRGPPEQLDPLAHPDQPVPAGCLRVVRRSGPVVGDLELERVRVIAHDDPGARSAGMPEGVGGASWTMR